MCTVEGERTAIVCDVAIGRVRQELQAAFAQKGIAYSLVEGRGTRVEADPTVDEQQFREALQRAIGAAQGAEPELMPPSERAPQQQ